MPKTSIFTHIARLAHRSGALNLAQGFPGFGVHPHLPERLACHAADGKNQYAPGIGIAPLRHAIADKVERLYGHAPDPDAEITVTSGATEALFCTFQALLGPGEEAIFFEPAYDCYEPGIRMAGAAPVPIALAAPDFRIDWDEVRSKISARTRLIVLNNPHNPSGTVLGTADLDRISALTRGTDITVVSDEVYQHLVYDGREHLSILRHPELRKRSVVTMSFGKTFHATGWRLGYTVAPPALTERLRYVHQLTTFSAFTPAQYAMADHLRQPRHYLELPAFFQQKRDAFLAAVAASPYPAIACAGTYFCCLDFSGHWSGSDLSLAEYLITRHGIAAIPLGEFYLDRRRTGLLRFCFAKEDELLARAGRLLTQLEIHEPNAHA